MPTMFLEPFTAHIEPSTFQAHTARPTKAGEQHWLKIPPTEMLPSARSSLCPSILLPLAVLIPNIPIQGILVHFPMVSASTPPPGSMS